MKKLRIVFIIVAIGILSVSAKKGLNSSVFEWEKLAAKKTATGEERVFFRSATRSLDMIDVKAVTLLPGEKGNGYQIDEGFNELIIVKEGTIEILINNENKVLGEGSVIVASNGDKVYITNPQKEKAVYYLIGFKPHKKSGATLIDTKITPLFIDWKNIEFKPSENGGRRNIMQQKTSALKELEIHVTTLKEGLPSHAPHTHPDEEIILVRKGFVEETIKGQPFRLGPGSIVFLTNDDMHGISNAGTGECEYFAIRWLIETK
jgi:quercetin dioxygenase-like cupin family protein